MPLHLQTPFDRAAQPLPQPKSEPDRLPEAELHALLAREQVQKLPRLDGPDDRRPNVRHWWGLAADCCYILIEAGAFLMACWITAMGLPLMLLLLLTGGQMDMSFAFLGTLFGAYGEASPDRQYSFASDATYCLVALATAISAWRLPRFLDRVSKTLGTWDKIS